MNINENVKELREYINNIPELLSEDIDVLKGILSEAADTIESLSAKLQAANEELEHWHTEKVNDKIKNPFAWTSTSICHNCDHKDEYIEELETANMEQSEAYYNDGWVYCGDGNNLPEKTGFYMVTKEMRETGGRFTGKSCFDAEKGWNDPLNFVDIVAWQPLPLEYKGHSKEGGDSK